jgi:hypothetical protein
VARATTTGGEAVARVVLPALTQAASAPGGGSGGRPRLAVAAPLAAAVDALVLDDSS